MKKNLLLSVVFILAGMLGVNAQVQIGNGTLDSDIPIDPFYGYTYSQSIYLASEINASGDITELSFQFNGNSTISSSTTWKVLIGHTTKTEFISTGDWELFSNLTDVYSGEIVVTGTGTEWITIDITDFTYNGTDNLIVAVNETTPDYDESSNFFYSTAVSSARSIFEKNDSAPNDPASPPTADGIPFAVSNIIFGGITQSCPDPSLLDAANISAFTADLSWTENGGATTWDIEIVLSGDAATGTPTYNDITNNAPFNATGLVQTQAYEFFVRADCGGDNIDVSSWIGPFVFTTLATCPPPGNLNALNLTATSADLSWTEIGSATAWDVELVLAGDAVTGVPSYNDVTANAPYSLSGLTASTSYEYYVRADCGQDDTDVSLWSGPFLFETPCEIVATPYLQPFTEALPSCWSNATNGTPVDGPLDFGSSSWIASTMFGGDSDLKINLYLNSKKEWMISPLFDINSSILQVELEVAVTDYYSNDQPDVMGSDDEVQLLITTDGGVTWTALQTWTVADNLPNTPTNVITSLSAYSGTVQFAIWASEGAVNDSEDYDFHIDNFRVRTPPTCPNVTDLIIANILDATAELSWTENAAATAWDIEVVMIGDAVTGVPTFNDISTNTSFNLTGLVASSSYEVYVRADCGQDDTDVSEWVGPLTFDTPCGIVLPPYSQGFTQALPNCWTNATNGTPIDGPLDPGSSSWLANTMFGGDEDLKVNLWQSDKKEWMISPVFDLAFSVYQIELEVAVTNYNNNDQPDVMGSDDEVQLLITTDGGTTWTALQTWTALDNLPFTPTNVVTSLSAYSGIVQFAIWASEGSVDDSEDYDFHIDNFIVRTPPLDDAGITAIEQPLESFMPGLSTPVYANLTNFGINDFTALDIEYTVEDITNGGIIATGTYNWAGSLSTGGEDLVLVTNFDSQPLTEYQITVTSVLANDADAPNDEVIINVTSGLVVSIFPYLEDFEDGGAVTDGWKTGSWEFVTTIEFGALTDFSTGTGYFAGLDDSNTSDGGVYELYSPYYDLTNETSPTFSFYLQNLDAGSAEPHSPLTVDVWNGTSWDMAVLSVDSPYDTWTEFSFSMATYAGINGVQVRFTGLNSSSYTSDLSIDNIKISLPLGTNALLADLTVNGVTVAGFDPMVYSYNVELPFSETVVPTVIGTPADANAIAGTVDAAGLPGSSIITVTAQDGITVQVYTVNFTLSSVMSNDATLSDLTTDAVTVTAFDPLTFTYDVELSPGTTIVPAVVGTTTHLGAVIAQVDATVLPGSTVLVVTAEDGVTENTYTINFTVPFNIDATLMNLTIDGLTVTGFDANTFDYIVNIPEGATVVPTVVGTPNDINALVFNTNAGSLPGTTSILVVAEDGVTTATYTVQFVLIMSVDNINDVDVNVYPNPSAGVFKIQTEERFDVEVSDISGKLILKFNTDLIKEIRINNSGMYFMKLKNDRGVISKKLIVN